MRRSGPSAEGDAEIVVEGRRYVLLGDNDGYSIWDLRGDPEVPVAEFVPTDDGLDDAIATYERLVGLARRGRVVAALAWLVGIVGVAWLVDSLVVSVVTIIVLVTDDQDLFESFWSTRLQALSFPLSVLPTTFTVAVGLYVVVWMQLRSRRRGD